MNQLFNAENVKRSILDALKLTNECNDSISRIKGFLANLPKGCLRIKQSNHRVQFFCYADNREAYISKSSPLLYKLCRKRYLLLLLRSLELKNELCIPESLSRRQVSTISKMFDNTLQCLVQLLDTYSRGNLDLARIVLTSNQYKWYVGGYRQKKRKPDIPLFTGSGVCVRSKSERDIGNFYEKYAVPYHYEEQMVINAAAIVKKLQQDLQSQDFQKSASASEVSNLSKGSLRSGDAGFSKGSLHSGDAGMANSSLRSGGSRLSKVSPRLGNADLAGKLSPSNSTSFSGRSCCYEKGGSCYWDVPPALQWMNAPGSIWRAYNPVTGKIFIYNDFRIMLADNRFVIHEHDGKVDETMYRCNASERTYIMRLTGAVNPDCLISTFESDVSRMDEIIRKQILPHLWF